MDQTRKNRNLVGPYSRRLRRGAIGDSVDGRSAEGRFIRDLERQLIAHVGGVPTIAQKLLIDRIVKCTMQIDALDRKLADGDWTDHDARTHGGLINRQRLLLREIGLQPATPKPPSLAEVTARIIAERDRREAVA
jgi:hypothetical protein